RDAVHATIREVKISRGSGRAKKGRARCLYAFEHLQELKLLGIAEDRPRQPARPRAERRVTLLGIRTAIASVVQVENALVRSPATAVIGISPFTIINAVLGGRKRVLN